MYPPQLVSLSRPPPLAKRQSSTTLPQGISGILPGCAQACVGAYVTSYWNSQKCDVNNDLGCLCDNYSSTGYTIGEIALACASRACGDLPKEQQQQLYGVCSNETAAVSASHTILTLLVSATPSSTATKPSSSSPVPTLTSSTTSGPSTPAPTAGSQSTAIATPTGRQPGGLTTGQAVGVTVGAFVGAFLILALLVLCIFCRRKRKKSQRTEDDMRRRDSYDFVCARTPHNPTFEPGGPHMRPQWASTTRDTQVDLNPPQEPPTGPHGAGMVKQDVLTLSPRAQNVSRNRSGSAPKSLLGNYAFAGAATSADRPRRASSPDTLNRWLDKLPAIAARRRSSAKRLSGPFDNDAEYDGRSSLIDAASPGRRFSFQGNSSESDASSLKHEKEPDLIPIGLAPGRPRNERPTIPSIIITDPKAAQKAPSPDALEHLSPKSMPASPQYGAENFIPSYYMSQASRTPQMTAQSPVRSQVSKAEWTKHLSMKALPTPPRRDSNHTTTSFESAASPRTAGLEERSPISGLRYPAIPRSAAEQTSPSSGLPAIPGEQPTTAASTMALQDAWKSSSPPTLPASRFSTARFPSAPLGAAAQLQKRMSSFRRSKTSEDAASLAGYSPVSPIRRKPTVTTTRSEGGIQSTRRHSRMGSEPLVSPVESRVGGLLAQKWSADPRSA